MPDAETIADPTLAEHAVDLATSDDAALDAALGAAGFGDDADGSLSLDDNADPEPATGADDAPGEGEDTDNADAGDDLLEAGIAEMARMGMSSANARKLLEANPDLVREFGEDAKARQPAAEPEQPAEPTDPIKDAKPEPGDDAADLAPIEQVLGAVFDKEEAGAVAKVLASMQSRVLAEVKKIVPDLSPVSKQLEHYDAALSELYGRRVVDDMAHDFPELRKPGAYEKVHAKAVALRQSGVKAPVRELIELAVLSEHGGKARAEVAAHRNKIQRAKASGAPSAAASTEPADKRSQADKDWDKVWEKAQRR